MLKPSQQGKGDGAGQTNQRSVVHVVDGTVVCSCVARGNQRKGARSKGCGGHGDVVLGLGLCAARLGFLSNITDAAGQKNE